MRRFAGIEEIGSRMTQIGWMNTDLIAALRWQWFTQREGDCRGDCSLRLQFVEPQRHKDTERHEEVLRVKKGKKVKEGCGASLAMSGPKRCMKILLC